MILRNMQYDSLYLGRDYATLQHAEEFLHWSSKFIKDRRMEATEEDDYGLGMLYVEAWWMSIRVGLRLGRLAHVRNKVNYVFAHWPDPEYGGAEEHIVEGYINRLW